eukprot:163337_1
MQHILNVDIDMNVKIHSLNMTLNKHEEAIQHIKVLYSKDVHLQEFILKNHCIFKYLNINKICISTIYQKAYKVKQQIQKKHTVLWIVHDKPVDLTHTDNLLGTVQSVYFLKT